MGLRRLGMAILFARDFDSLRGWYTDVLGLEVAHLDEAGKWVDLRFRDGDATLAIHGGLAAPSSEARPPAIVPAIEVDDIRATVEELKGRGLAFAREVHEGVGVLLASFADPEGNAIQLYERKEAR